MISLRIYLLVGAQVPEEGDVLLSGHFLRVALVTDFSRLTAFCIFSKFFKTTLETLHVFDIFNNLHFFSIAIDLDHCRIWIIVGFGSFLDLDHFWESVPNRSMIQMRQ
jgi:hypothetical protein